MIRGSRRWSTNPVRSSSASVLLFLCATLTASAAWVENGSQAEPSISGGLVHQRFEMEDPDSGNSAGLELARFSAKSHQLRLIENRGGSESLAESMRKENCLAGVNGGYFDPDFAPIGLRIAGGLTKSPFVRSRLLTGVLVYRPGAARIVRLREYSRETKPLMALECGPFLVDGGKVVSGLDSTRAARRTFVATAAGDQVILGFCSPVSLADLSRILAHGLPGLKIRRALNLDGGSSSAFWFERKDSSAFSVSEQKPVRDFIGVSSR